MTAQKQATIILAAALVGCYLGLSGAMMVRGIVDAKSETCQRKWLRLEYVLPAFRLGCWIGQEP